MATLSYHEQKNIENTKKLRELQKELPYFCTDFFRIKEHFFRQKLPLFSIISVYGNKAPCIIIYAVHLSGIALRPVLQACR